MNLWTGIVSHGIIWRTTTPSFMMAPKNGSIKVTDIMMLALWTTNESSFVVYFDSCTCSVSQLVAKNCTIPELHRANGKWGKKSDILRPYLTRRRITCEHLSSSFGGQKASLHASEVLSLSLSLSIGEFSSRVHVVSLARHSAIYTFVIVWKNKNVYCYEFRPLHTATFPKGQRAFKRWVFSPSIIVTLFVHYSQDREYFF